MKSIYKNTEAKNALMNLYDEKLNSLNIEYQNIDINTFAGNTRVIVTGAENGKPVVVFHGINAGSPLTLEAIKGLLSDYKIYAIDTVGQTTKSAETRLPLNDNSIARWIDEVLEGLNLKSATFIGVSYGAFLLQRLMKYYPQRIEKSIFIVPSGFVNGSFVQSMVHLTWPLMKFLASKKETHLIKFMNSFYDTKDAHAISMQKNTLLGTYMDYRRPPLISKNDVLNFNTPVYAMVSDNDVFFPGHKSLEKCKAIFNNFKGYHILKNTKHMPEKNQFLEIETIIRQWLKA